MTHFDIKCCLQVIIKVYMSDTLHIPPTNYSCTLCPHTNQMQLFIPYTFYCTYFLCNRITVKICLT